MILVKVRQDHQVEFFDAPFGHRGNEIVPVAVLSGVDENVVPVDREQHRVRLADRKNLERQSDGGRVDVGRGRTAADRRKADGEQKKGQPYSIVPNPFHVENRTKNRGEKQYPPETFYGNVEFLSRD